MALTRANSTITDIDGAPLVHLRGEPEAMGFFHGRAIRPMLERAFDAYLDEMARLTKVPREALAPKADAWLRCLPLHVQREIAGMAEGAGRSVDEITRFLYADIASASPLCSGILTDTPEGPWAARNCDWWRACLMRGTSVVVHETPGLIPVLAVGIAGDIDVDTGANAERLWIHVHTLFTRDKPRTNHTSLSWLFWTREALETCASLEELERFLSVVDRDRGMILFAADGKTGEYAVYEATCASWERIDPDPGPTITATNHCQAKHPDDPERRGRSRAGSSTARLTALRARIESSGRLQPPRDLEKALADPLVEMRTPVNLATIYAAACNPKRGELLFASGRCPAASQGRWRRIPWPF